MKLDDLMAASKIALTLGIAKTDWDTIFWDNTFMQVVAQPQQQNADAGQPNCDDHDQCGESDDSAADSDSDNASDDESNKETDDEQYHTESDDSNGVSAEYDDVHDSDDHDGSDDWPSQGERMHSFVFTNAVEPTVLVA